MSQTWKIDPRSGDYIMEKGAPVPTDRLSEPCFYRLRTKRTQWMYAPDTDFGSDYYLEKKNRTTGDQSKLETIGAKAVQPIVDDGRASEVEIVATEVARNGVALTLKITDAQGQVERLTINPIVT